MKRVITTNTKAPPPLFPAEGARCLPTIQQFAAMIFRLQLSEILNGADHLRGVAVLVVVPRNDLNLIGVPLNFIAVLLFLCLLVAVCFLFS